MPTRTHGSAVCHHTLHLLFGQVLTTHTQFQIPYSGLIVSTENVSGKYVGYYTEDNMPSNGGWDGYYDSSDSDNYDDYNYDSSSNYSDSSYSAAFFRLRLFTALAFGRRSISVATA